MTFLSLILSFLFLLLFTKNQVVFGQTSDIFKCPCHFKVIRYRDLSTASDSDPFDVVVRPTYVQRDDSVDSELSIRNIQIVHAIHTDAFAHHFKSFSILEEGQFHVSVEHKLLKGAAAPLYSLTQVARVREPTLCPILLPFDLPPPVSPISRSEVDSETRERQSAEIRSVEEDSVTPNIIGGLPANSNLERYMVAVRTPVECRDPERTGCHATCSGSLIAPNWIITAAHCLLKVNETKVHLNTDRADRGEITRIAEFHKNPFYNSSQFNTSTHDIAVAKLTTNVIRMCRKSKKCGGVPSVMAINFNTDTPMDGQYLRTVGYGLITAGHTPFTGFLRQVDLPVSDFGACKDAYFNDLRTPVVLKGHFQICAGYRSGVCDSCNGDSGGPLIGYVNGPEGAKPVLVGITSFGAGCGYLNGVYVRVSGHKKWLKSIGVPLTKSKAILPTFGPMCKRGKYLSYQPGLAKCRKCPLVTSSIPPARECTACPNNTLQDTVDPGTCSCRRYEGLGEKGAGAFRRCKRCPSGTRSPIGSNTCE